MKNVKRKLAICLMLSFVLGLYSFSSAYAYTVPSTIYSISSSSSYTGAGYVSTMGDLASKYLFTGANDYNLKINSVEPAMNVKIMSYTYGTQIGSLHISSAGSYTVMAHSSTEKIYFIFTDDTWNNEPLTFSYTLSKID